MAGGVGIFVERGRPAWEQSKEYVLYKALYDTGRFIHVIVHYDDGKQSVHIMCAYAIPKGAAMRRDECDAPDHGLDESQTDKEKRGVIMKTINNNEKQCETTGSKESQWKPVRSTEKR